MCKESSASDENEQMKSLSREIGKFIYIRLWENWGCPRIKIFLVDILSLRRLLSLISAQAHMHHSINDYECVREQQ